MYAFFEGKPIDGFMGAQTESQIKEFISGVFSKTGVEGDNEADKILEKAKEIEKKMKESQENLKKIEVNGASGGDVVKVTLNGDGEMTKILLSDKVLKEDKEIIQDLITAAHNDAKNKLKSKTSEEISKATGGLGVPGFKWPL